MTRLLSILLLITLAVPAMAGLWPSGAMPDPESGSPGPLPGRLAIDAGGQYLHSGPWHDTRTRLGLRLGLGSGLGLSVSNTVRHMAGYRSYQLGNGDTRLGLSFWPDLQLPVSVGVSGYFTAPTGFRRQQEFFDEVGDSLSRFPAYSLGRSAGECYGGATWRMAPAAELGTFAGYFATSDQADQAFRWGLRARLTPFGEQIAAEFSYSQSLVRTGDYPHTEHFALDLPLRLSQGLTLAPGLAADLDPDQFFGLSLGLRYELPLPGASEPAPHGSRPKGPQPASLPGRVLVAPPLSQNPLTDRDELWRSIQQGVRPQFDGVIALPSLDLPGLPFDQSATAAALAAAYPEARWLLVTRVEDELVSRDGKIAAPLAGWSARCRLHVQLIDLLTQRTRAQRTLDVEAVRKPKPLDLILYSPDRTVLSLHASRALTLEAYEVAGRKIAREVCHVE